MDKKPINKSDMQMINISACEFGEFEKYMVSQYGVEQFTKGFQIIKTNRNILYEDKGEIALQKMLEHLKFADAETMNSFINFCTTYLIVQNMQC